MHNQNPEFLLELVRTALQRLLEAEMMEHLGAAPHERTKGRSGHRNGYKPRQMKTRGWLELMNPQDRDGTFKTELFNRYQRSKKALVTTLKSSCPAP